MTKLEGASYGPHGEGKAGHLVILLHGYGADGNDLIGLAPVLAPLMPDVVFHAPNAPYPCEGNPFGYQWFGISRLDPAMALAGVRAAAPLVDAFLDEKMAEHGLDESRTALVGFSQGTMMALQVGLRRHKQLAGIVGFSGMLAGAGRPQGRDQVAAAGAAGARRQRRDAAAHADRTRRRGAEGERREGRRPHRQGRRPRHRRDRPQPRCALPAQGVQAAGAEMTAKEIGGTCKPGFERVAEAFKANFDKNGEIGASVCLKVGGETVVDLWGGVADPKSGAPWKQDTVSIVFSCTKGATALCAHILASAASSTSMRPSPSCGRSSASTARSASPRA